jgi:hypothetical protein
MHHIFLEILSYLTRSAHLAWSLFWSPFKLKSTLGSAFVLADSVLIVLDVSLSTLVLLFGTDVKAADPPYIFSQAQAARYIF